MTQVLFILFGLGTLVGLLYLLWRPYWAFILIICMFPLEQLLQSYVPVLGAQSWIVNVGVALLAIFAISTRIMKSEPMTFGYMNKVTVMVLCLYAVYAVGLIWTPAPEVGRSFAQRAAPYWVLYVILFPLIVLSVADFRRMLTGLMVLGSLLAVFIIANPKSSYHAGRLVLDLGMVGYRSSGSGNPLAIAEMGAMIALVAALIRPPAPSTLFTLIRIGAFFTGFGLAIGSGSRGQVLAAGIVGLMYFPLSRKLANPKQFMLVSIGLATLAGALILVFRLFVGDQNRERWDVFQMIKDMGLRLDNVWLLFHHWIETPAAWLLGLGPNAFAAIAPNVEEQYVHNVAAEILCEQGVVGFALLLGMIVVTIKQGFRLFRIYADDPSMRATVAVLIAQCTNAFFLVLKQGSLANPTPFFWWMLLVKLSLYEQATAPIQEVAVDEEAYDDELTYRGLQQPALARMRWS